MKKAIEPKPATEVPLTADESSALMVGAERAAILDGLKKLFPRFIGALSVKRESTFDAIHAAQEMGAQIELFFGCGKVMDSHENALALSLRDAEHETAAPPCFARKLLSLHQKHPEPITNPAIASAELEKLEEQLKLIDAGTRKAIDDIAPNAAQLREKTVHEAYDFWIRTSQGMVKVEKELSYADWRDNELDTLIMQGRPGFESYQRAVLERKRRS